jgi:methionyl-tRNA formyltransferase
MVSIAFLGSHPLGVECLRRLADDPDVSVEVVCTYPPDHEGWWEGSVYDLAAELGYPTCTIAEEQRLREYPIDYLLSVYYPNVLGPELLDHPDRGALNLHQAELPRYRGSNVFSHAIMNARPDDHWRQGTTLHFMAEAVDAGDVVDRKFVSVTEEDTARTLAERTEEASIELFEETLPAIVSGAIDDMGTPQAEFDGKRYFYAKDSLEALKAIPTDALTDPDREAAIYDRIRALDFPPFEPAYTELGDRRVYLTATAYEELV